MFSPRGKEPITLITLSIIAIFISGLFFGITHFLISSFHTSLQDVDCDLPEETGYLNCQEWFSDTIYKLLNLKYVFVTFSYIFIFVLVLGMLIVGYNIGGNPIYMGIYFLAILLLTYCGILISNIYRDFLMIDIVYEIMQPFTIYNKIMLNFPWFVGIIGLISIGLSIVNYQRVKVNRPNPTSVLDY